jgi:hypothetical protein
MQGLSSTAVVGTLTAMLMCTGCAEQNEPAARAAAESFADDLASDDGAGACRALAPATRAALEQSSGRPCAAAIVEEELPDPGAAGRSASFGTMAKVDFAADTMFVTEFSDGWKVMAAGCSPAPGDRPYDCSLQGG